jgi:two-component system, LuxR family, response regulator FixJ
MTINDSLVFVVDDDAPSREAVTNLARSMQLRAESFASAEEFLDRYRGQPGCVVVDLRMPGLSGVELQEELGRRGHPIPVIVVTGHAHTAAVVRAMRNGAVSVLDKPVDEEELWQAVRTALAHDADRRRLDSEMAETRQRLANLTEKERDVLRMIVAGRPNKAMANVLGASLRTVENRRREVFSKLGVRSVAELVAMTLRAKGEV